MTDDERARLYERGFRDGREYAYEAFAADLCHISKQVSQAQRRFSLALPESPDSFDKAYEKAKRYESRWDVRARRTAVAWAIQRRQKEVSWPLYWVNWRTLRLRNEV